MASSSPSSSPYTSFGNGTDKNIKTTLAPTVSVVPTPPSPEPTATLGQKTAQDKVDLKYQPVQYYIKASFMITYILLLTTATITFIEALRSEVPEVRHILNLETCISLVAGYFYSVFLTQIDNNEKKKFEWAELTKTRYVDWSITTPLMLFNLCVFLCKENKRDLGISAIVIITVLNYLMLLTGYLGDAGTFNRTLMFVVSFIFFFAMFYFIFVKYVDMDLGFRKNSLFFIYLVVWGLYGVVYLLEESWKNICLNILDCIAKCLVGIGLWFYYINMINWSK